MRASSAPHVEGQIQQKSGVMVIFAGWVHGKFTAVNAHGEMWDNACVR